MAHISCGIQDITIAAFANEYWHGYGARLCDGCRNNLSLIGMLDSVRNVRSTMVLITGESVRPTSSFASGTVREVRKARKK